MTSKMRRPLAALAVVLALAVIGAACSSDSDSSSSDTSAAPGTSAGSGSSGDFVEGCEELEVTLGGALGSGVVPRCEPGAPAPEPLPERVSITVASSQLRSEWTAPLQLAKSRGEFEAENLDVEFVSLPYSDAVPQMANGQIDAATGGLEGALFVAGFNNLPVKAVMAMYYPPHAGNYDVQQNGLWCRRDSFTNPADPDYAEIEDMVIASAAGRGSVGIAQAVVEIQKRVPDFDYASVNIQSIPAADTLAAIQAGSVDCGYMLDPAWVPLAEDPNMVMMTISLPVSSSQISFGRNLLVDDRAAGEAFIRAMIRTVNTYFADDYHGDPEVMGEIAVLTGQPLDALTQFDSFIYDWQLREGVAQDYQQIFIDMGVITQYTDPLPDERIYDREFYDLAVRD